jgi:hypothetical protein
MIARFSLSEGGGMKFIPLIFQYSIQIYMAQFENLGELVKNTIFVA